MPLFNLFEKVKKLLQPDIDGMQQKWIEGDSYVKIDETSFTGEGLAETVASAILEKSNIDHFVKYHPIIRNGKTGCISDNFLTGAEEFIPITDMMKLARCRVYDMIPRDIAANPDDSVKMFIEDMSKVPGLENINDYCAKMFRFDAIVKNKDRTFYNFGVVSNRKAKTMRMAPVFDNGQSFCFVSDGWKSGRVVEVAASGTARPFCPDFNKQASLFEKYSKERFCSTFSLKDLDVVLDECSKVYPAEMIEKVRKVFTYQMYANLEYFRNDEHLDRMNRLTEAAVKACDGFSLDDSNQDSNTIVMRGNSDPKETVIVDVHGQISHLYDGKEIPFHEVVLKYPRIRNAEQALSSVIADIIADNRVGDNRVCRERNFQSR